MASAIVVGGVAVVAAVGTVGQVGWLAYWRRGLLIFLPLCPCLGLLHIE